MRSVKFNYTTVAPIDHPIRKSYLHVVDICHVSSVGILPGKVAHLLVLGHLSPRRSELVEDCLRCVGMTESAVENFRMPVHGLQVSLEVMGTTERHLLDTAFWEFALAFATTTSWRPVSSGAASSARVADRTWRRNFVIEFIFGIFVVGLFFACHSILIDDLNLSLRLTGRPPPS